MLDQKLELWKKSLLELGKRNRLINYKEIKRSNINVASPDINELYQLLVVKEKALKFPYPVEKETENGEVIIEATSNGDIYSDRTIVDQQKTLRSIRSKARSYVQEQGVNVLYMVFGFLEWKEAVHSDVIIKSPLVLVPVSLTIDSVSDPFVLSLHEDEIVVNPTLAYKLEEEFGITLPEFHADEEDVVSFLKKVGSVINNNSWKITHERSLALLSFMKINMYKDLENNHDRIISHPVLQALAGDSSNIEPISEAYEGFDHDNKIKPIDTFQVVDADSSQQDAILYSKKNLSFILQGPPGTGKSQTITNIIAEGLADGKKILFVSEKSAALEVVHSRLTNVGLGEFCLSLHSNKKSKKEVLSDLAYTLNLAKMGVREESLYKLYELEKERDALNAYIRDLHMKNQPLNKSIFEVSGLLSKLPECKDLMFDIPDIESIDMLRLNEAIRLLDEFSHTLGTMKKDYHENPWVGCNLKQVSHKFRLDAEINLEKLIEEVMKLKVALSEFNEEMELELSIKVDEIDEYISLIDYIEASPDRVPLTWLQNETISITEATNKAKEYKRTLADYHSIKSELSMKYEDGFLDLNGQETYELLKDQKNQVEQLLNNLNKNTSDVLRRYTELVTEIDELIRGLNEVVDSASKFQEESKLRTIDTIDDLDFYEKLLIEIEKKPCATAMWFDESQVKIVDVLLDEATQRLDRIKVLETEIGESFEHGFQEVDYQAILVRFRTKYTNVFKYLSKQYRQDKAEIRGFYKGDGTIDDATIIGATQKLSEINENRIWFEMNDDFLKGAFGDRYLSNYTDWNAIRNSRETFEKIRALIGNDLFGAPIKKMLSTNELPDVIREARLTINEYRSNGQWAEILGLLNLNSINSKSIQDIPTTLENLKEKLSKLHLSMERVAKPGECDVLLKDCLSDLKRKSKLDEILNKLNAEYQELTETFSDLFEGTETDWDEIINALAWAEGFNKYKNIYGFSNKFIENYQTTKAHKELQSNLITSRDKIRSEWIWFKSLFDESRRISEIKVGELVEVLNACESGFTLLEEWVDYRRHRKECDENGLGEYVQKAEDADMLKTNLLNGYLRRFYKHWLDIHIKKYPSVAEFRKKAQTKRIENFKELDTLSLDIAKARVRSKLIERLPNTNFTISAKDEKSILNRELNKKRRIMPLRRLFGSIPNLLMAIKPCMMMSPLSVSQFLQAETYDFDMIIFDEASQVKTEDAVGAIMRGESVIICGDTHQLPPTNFFGSSIHGDEYDNDDEELDVYDSILDEANHVLPDRRLKWHYRSKHEHLIAFSNALIYKHNLVTFPSAIEEAPNEGVEYIYVENGVYDRGGKRNNINEARKVVIMVIEHFKHYPTRSLGVVTFSRAQKDIIDDELQNYRLKDNSFEEYFSEDKKEAFFVKSLEMVQGDERDTIIFSIGYAKDRTGKPMSMNFGPLTQTGGERRLNVAITRAKHNVKLVGSIHPTDIDLDRTKSEGVKLLREYINFAINGPKVLESKTTNENDGMFDSPFEESVYDFLAMKNYKVASQIGCSGYRIDLAVKHPEHSGVYVLGIECDGATYHSTRTVRERDRIRQTVLEDMGWKIYRIWSTDYIKDPKNEQRKLVDYIDKCIREFTVEPINKTKPVEIINKPNVIDHLIVSKVQPAGSSDANVKNYGFGHYKVAQLQKEQYRYAGHINFANAVTDIIDIESPIHFDLLCKRIAPLADYEKATKRVRKVVADSIDKSIDQIDQRHDFLWKKDEKTANVRIPSEDSVIRKIEYIAPEEISVAMSTIISSSYGITEEGLYTETRRIFGFNRSGAKIVKAFDEAYQRMSDEGKIKIIDDKISLV